MSFHRVQWHEGMLLEPQHFQEFQRNTAAVMTASLQRACPFFWGVQNLVIDTTALLSGTFRITALNALFPDGSYATITNEDTALPTCDIKNKIDKNNSTPTTIYLAIVRYRPDAANTQSDFPRYQSNQIGPVVDENTGESGIHIPTLSLALTLLVGDDIPPRYIAFPIAKVVYRDDGYVPTSFIPPSTDIREGSALRPIVATMVGHLRDKINFLSTKVVTYGQKMDTPLFEAYQFYFNTLAPLAPQIEVLLNAEMVHPFEVYQTLCQIAGKLSLLSPGQIPPIFPKYQHDDLMGTFTPVLSFIDEMLHIVKRLALAIPLAVKDAQFQIQIKPDWKWQSGWIVGVRSGPGMSEDAVMNWIKGAIILTQNAMESAKERRILGAKRAVSMEIPEAGLFPEDNILYVTIEHDAQFIDDTGLLCIVNQNDTPDARPSSIVLFAPTHNGDDK